MSWRPEWRSRTLLMAVLNVTPDSFSGDGIYGRPDEVVRRAGALARAGADVLDIGGESTRPGYRPVEEEEELARVIPAIRAVRQRVDIPISIDTSKPAVARAALGEGASIVNDVSGLRDPAMVEEVARSDATLVLVHPDRMEVGLEGVRALVDDLRRRLRQILEAGVPMERIIVDPGLGFGKVWRENFAVIRHLSELRSLGLPVLVGPSRKEMIGRVLGVGPRDRIEGTAALVSLSIAGGADMVRVHDVETMARVTRVMDAIVRGAPGGPSDPPVRARDSTHGRSTDRAEAVPGAGAVGQTGRSR